MKELIETLREYFTQDSMSFEFNASMFLAGENNKAKRSELMELVTGVKKPSTKCSFHACVQELTNMFNQPSLF